MDTETMQKALTDAYRHPDRKQCFYSADSLDTASATLNRMKGWDWTPTRSWCLEEPTHLHALAFGCPPKTTSTGGEWVEKLITDPGRVKDLGVPDIYATGTGEILNQLKERVETLPAGDLIRMPDIQSPLGNAELMWDDSFYIALIEYPDAVHELLQKITAFIIRYAKEVQDILGDRLNPFRFPKIWGRRTGCYVSDDTMTLVSPEMHREFSVPYINQIGEACGPLCYHSCTWRNAYFDNLRQIKNVMSWNWNPSNADDVATIIKEFSGTAVIALHLDNDMHLTNDVLSWGHGFGDEADLLRYFLDSMQDTTTLSLSLSPTITNADMLDKAYAILKAYGYAPDRGRTEA